MKKLVSKVFVVVLCCVLFAMSSAVPANAASVKIENGKTYTAKQIANANLSQGIIRWSDDMVSGYIRVDPADKKGKKYTVWIREIQRVGLPANPSNKQKLRGWAESIFWPIRSYAQTKGYWDCEWRIKSNNGKTLKATAKVAYYAVKATEKSRELNITQVATLKNNKYSTYYVVNGKKYTQAELKKLFK